MQRTLTHSPTFYLLIIASPASDIPLIDHSFVCATALSWIGRLTRETVSVVRTSRGSLWAFPQGCSRYPACLLVGVWLVRTVIKDRGDAIVAAALLSTRLNEPYSIGRLISLIQVKQKVSLVVFWLIILQSLFVFKLDSSKARPPLLGFFT